MPKIALGSQVPTGRHARAGTRTPQAMAAPLLSLGPAGHCWPCLPMPPSAESAPKGVMIWKLPPISFDNLTRGTNDATYRARAHLGGRGHPADRYAGVRRQP